MQGEEGQICSFLEGKKKKKKKKREAMSGFLDGVRERKRGETRQKKKSTPLLTREGGGGRKAVAILSRKRCTDRGRNNHPLFLLQRERGGGGPSIFSPGGGENLEEEKRRKGGSSLIRQERGGEKSVPYFLSKKKEEEHIVSFRLNKEGKGRRGQKANQKKEDYLGRKERKESALKKPEGGEIEVDNYKGEKLFCPLVLGKGREKPAVVKPISQRKREKLDRDKKEEKKDSPSSLPKGEGKKTETWNLVILLVEKGGKRKKGD